jgi:hypothetical protein
MWWRKKAQRVHALCACVLRSPSRRKAAKQLQTDLLCSVKSAMKCYPKYLKTVFTIVLYMSIFHDLDIVPILDIPKQKK